MPADLALSPTRNLSPVFRINGHDHTLLTQAMSAVPVSAMGHEAENLAKTQVAITRALDMVFQGF